MNNQVLSIEQMQELKELGIDTSKASMYRTVINMDGIPSEVIVSKDYAIYWMENSDVELIPTCSIQDILEMLPAQIECKFNEGWQCFTLNFTKETDNLYIISYWDAYETYEHVIKFEGDDVLLNAFNMLKWCKRNNYI